MYGFCNTAADMFHLAVMLAGFDRVELMLEIARLHPGHEHRISEPIVLQAMSNIYVKYAREDQEKLK